MNTEIKETYEGTTVTVEFLTGRPLRRSHLGKHWPIVTQCIIKFNGLVIGVGEAVKHENDTDNPAYGKRCAAKKAFNDPKCKLWREMRTRLWSKILAS